MSAFGTMPSANLLPSDAMPLTKQAMTEFTSALKPVSLPNLDTPGKIEGMPGSGLSAQPAGSFADMLGRFVGDVNASQQNAAAAVNGLQGGNVPLHQAMIAMEEANVSFQLMVEVRNKLLESYQELMRTNI